MTFAIDSTERNILMSSTKGSFSVHEVIKKTKIQKTFLQHICKWNIGRLEFHICVFPAKAEVAFIKTRSQVIELVIELDFFSTFAYSQL